MVLTAKSVFLSFRAKPDSRLYSDSFPQQKQIPMFTAKSDSYHSLMVFTAQADSLMFTVKSDSRHSLNGFHSKPVAESLDQKYDFEPRTGHKFSG
jgi:hypothetical protein